jgi:hypothetical protein
MAHDFPRTLYQTEPDLYGSLRWVFLYEVDGGVGPRHAPGYREGSLGGAGVDDGFDIHRVPSFLLGPGTPVTIALELVPEETHLGLGDAVLDLLGLLVLFHLAGAEEVIG